MWFWGPGCEEGNTSRWRRGPRIDSGGGSTRWMIEGLRVGGRPQWRRVFGRHSQRTKDGIFFSEVQITELYCVQMVKCQIFRSSGGTGRDSILVRQSSWSKEDPRYPLLIKGAKDVEDLRRG